MARHRLCAEADLPRGKNRSYTVGPHAILLCHSDAGWFAVAAQCTHAAAALEGGRMRGVHLFCPFHGARFDMRDGKTAGQMALKPLATWPVTLDGGSVLVELPD